MLQKLFITGSFVLLAACVSKVPLHDTNTVPINNASMQQDTLSAPIQTLPPPVATIDPLNDPNALLGRQSIYFDYNKYDIRTTDTSLVTAHASYLKSQSRNLRIEGNTDARGSAEYNLALGQKRAEAVRKRLSLLGVPQEQMEAISYGKEKPRALGHDETSYAQNRRVDLNYHTYSH